MRASFEGARRDRWVDALRRLDLWGIVVRERRVTGDPSAVPKGAPEWAEGLKPPAFNGSTPSGILDVFLDVEGLITQSESPLIRPILSWRHVDGVTYRATKATVTLADGSQVEMSDEEFGERPPVGYTGVVYGYDRIEEPWKLCPCLVAIGKAGRIAAPTDATRWLYNRFVEVVSGQREFRRSGF